MGIFSRRGKDLFTVPDQGGPAVLPAGSFAASSGFWMVVKDCFAITGRGVVVTGTVESGTIAVGSRANLERSGQVLRSLEIGGIERSRNVVNSATAGESVGLLLRGVAKGDIVRGDIIRA